MDKQKQILLNCIIIFFILIFIFFIVKFYPTYKVIFVVTIKMIFPFVIAAFISYLIHPLVIKLNHHRINMTFSILIIYASFIFLVFILVYKSMPVFIFELEELSKQLPQLIQSYEEMVYQLYDSTSFLPEMVHDKMDQMIVRIENIIDQKISRFLEITMNITDIIVVLATIPVLVFYFLKDFTQIKTWTKKFIPRKHHNRFESILKAIDDGLGGYIRGQFFISSVIFFLTYLVYYVIDIKYALILAVIMSITNIIPYFGPLIGTIPAALIALSTSVKVLIIVLVTNAVVQILESSILSPYIMGKNVRIHPIALIFTLIVGAEIGGIVGMIIAVPIVTITRAITIQLQREKRLTN